MNTCSCISVVPSSPESTGPRTVSTIAIVRLLSRMHGAGLLEDGVGHALCAAVRGLAAVHGDLGPGDERRLVGDQEHHERRDLVGGADASEWGRLHIRPAERLRR